MILFKKPTKIIFFGGGKILFFLINFLKQKKIELVVFTEKRHLKEYKNKKVSKIF